MVECRQGQFICENTGGKERKNWVEVRTSPVFHPLHLLSLFSWWRENIVVRRDIQRTFGLFGSGFRTINVSEGIKLIITRWHKTLKDPHTPVGRWWLIHGHSVTPEGLKSWVSFLSGWGDSFIFLCHRLFLLQSNPTVVCLVRVNWITNLQNSKYRYQFLLIKVIRQMTQGPWLTPVVKCTLRG